jgi:tetratricopeptide repeat protein 7
VSALLSAAKICSDHGSDHSPVVEGMQYANRPVKLSEKATDNHLKGIALRYLGRCQGKSVKLVSSNLERSLLQAETLNSLGEAILLDKENPDPVYDLGLEYAK